jgi:hypothetical protein
MPWPHGRVSTSWGQYCTCCPTGITDKTALSHSQIDAGDLDLMLATAEAISAKLGGLQDGDWRRCQACLLSSEGPDDAMARERGSAPPSAARAEIPCPFEMMYLGGIAARELAWLRRFPNEIVINSVS